MVAMKLCNLMDSWAVFIWGSPVVGSRVFIWLRDGNDVLDGRSWHGEIVEDLGEFWRVKVHLSHFKVKKRPEHR